MKKYFFWLSIGVLMLHGMTGCNKEVIPENIQVADRMTLDQLVNADDKNGVSSIDFTTLGPWTSSLTPSGVSSWISYSPKSGKTAGEYSVSITLQTNTTGKDREANINIVCEGETITINVKQKATAKDGSTYNSKVPSGVYVAGSEKSKAVLWTNNGMQKLGNSSNNSYARSVFVSGSDVYVSGYESNAQNEYFAILWKNGTAQYLTNGPYLASANAVYVSGNDVYVAGYESNGSRGVAKLWKNGVAQNLSDGTHTALTYAVFVSGEDAYVAGCEFNEQDNAVAKVWKNRVAQNLSVSSSEQAEALSVFVSGSDVYVAGYERNAQGKDVAALWKNGIVQYLTNGTNMARAHSIYVLGNDIYVAGREVNTQDKAVAKLWKNGTAQNLSDGTDYAEAESIFVSGSDVFVTVNDGGILFSKAKLWHNGKAQFLGTDFSALTSSQAKSVFVVK